MASVWNSFHRVYIYIYIYINVLKLYLWADKFCSSLDWIWTHTNGTLQHQSQNLMFTALDHPTTSAIWNIASIFIYIYIADVANWSRMLDISISDWRALKSCWERTKKLSAQKSNSNTIELNISHYIYSERYSHKQDIKYTMIQIYCLLSIYGNIIIGNTYIKTVVYLWCIENVNISRQYMM
jgi:hypothetical protein